MDIKKMIEKLIDEIQKDGKLGTQFKNDPVKVIEAIIGKDLPDETVEKIIDGVKAKINLDMAVDAIDKIDDMLDNVDLGKASDILNKVDDVADVLKKFF